MRQDHNAVRIYDMLFAIQLFAFFTLFLSDCLAPRLTQAAYCIVVYLSPLLLIVYGYWYLYNEKISLKLLIPFFAELTLATLFIMTMIYGIRTLSQPAQGLFGRLLIIYTVDAVICLLAHVLVICGRRRKASRC